MSGTDLDIATLRARLEADDGPDRWTSLDNLARTPEFESWASSEFPSAWEEARLSDVKRRDFLKIMGASMGLAGLTSACVRQPEEKIYAYVRQPEELLPGVPLHYASAIERAGYGTGVLVETHMYRPTHLAGNPDHPDSRGGTDPQVQASVLGVWDPDRSQNIVDRGNTSSWSQFVVEVAELLPALARSGGQGLRVLTGAVGSPLLAEHIERFLSVFPEARWHQWEAASRWNAHAGAKMAFGDVLEARYELSDAKTVFALDADFLGNMPGAIRHEKDLMGQRNDFDRVDEWARIYVAEPSPTPVGAVADHRVRIRASAVGALLGAVAEALGIDVQGPKDEGHGDFVKAVVDDLREAGPRGVVIVGDDQPAEVHALAFAINDRLGAIGRTVKMSDPVLHRPEDHQASLAQLSEDMDAEKVDILLMLGVNPLFDAPADSTFRGAFEKVGLRVHVGEYIDETAELSHWHVPRHHYLESWGDCRAVDGTVSIVQPTMKPLYASKSFGDVLDLFLGKNNVGDHERLLASYEAKLGKKEMAGVWNKALHAGVLAGSARPPRQPSLQTRKFTVPEPSKGLEIDFDADPNVFDGRYANNAWLQELPRPLSKITWDNAAYVSPTTADALGLKPMDLVELEVDGRVLEVAAWILPGQADEVVTLHYGLGRRIGGTVARDTGFDAFKLRTAAHSSFGPVEVRKREGRYPIACVQDHFHMEGRSIVRSSTVERFKKDPAFAKKADHVKMLTLWEPYEYKGHKWGMTINLSSCTGCNTCIVACQSENNISVVGKDEVYRGREMHWVRIDRYFDGSLDDPNISFQPLSCVMCENAPCETVCPVNATVHGPEGLNQMVYNRCVGTRYCSNNCPYKVRRFNFRLYSDYETESLKGQKNPDVTVRSRGVMEKCTYCVQRLNRAKIQAEVHGDGKLPTDSVKVACQDACPSGAIVFGDLNDPESQVAKNYKHPTNYSPLKELNTKPRTTYLARVTNTNAKLGGAEVDPHEH
ncbi:MAG: TAT-variant-translocated molybdopterin oxidoreductase [Myxococcota bacterium]